MVVIEVWSWKNLLGYHKVEEAWRAKLILAKFASNNNKGQEQEEERRKKKKKKKKACQP